jgi:hypothetical protein
MAHQTPFNDLAQALRDAAAAAREGKAALGQAGDAGLLAELATRAAAMDEAARVLADLAPHQVLVRSLIEVGELAVFPAYRPGGELLAGDDVLVRGKFAEQRGEECMVDFSAGSSTIRRPVDRADIVGIARKLPSLWRS